MLEGVMVKGVVVIIKPQPLKIAYEYLRNDD
jgi:hypothetical protein